MPSSAIVPGKTPTGVDVPWANTQDETQQNQCALTDIVDPATTTVPDVAVPRKRRGAPKQNQRAVGNALDPVFAAAEKAATIGAVEVFCELCNTGHNYKSLKALNKHNKSASHKKRLDPGFAATDEAAKKAKQDSKAEVFCELCNNGQNYKSLKALNQHNKSASHKKRLDPESAAAAKAEVFCELCNNGQNYKTQQALDQHNNSALHKKRLDPDFVAADEAAKKAKQEIYGEKVGVLPGTMAEEGIL